MPDERQLRDLYARYGPALRRKCERMLANSQDAEDVVQSLFIDMMSKGPGVDLTLPYLYTAATRRCLNRLRDGRRRRALLERHGTATLVLAHGDLAERVISLDVLAQLVDRLQGPLADVFVHLFVDQMTQAEVATLMGTSRKTVGHRLQRIRAELDALLGAEP